VYNYNARYALTPLDLGRDIPQPDLISDLVVAYDTVTTLKTDGEGLDVVVTRSNTKISPYIKDKVAIIYLNDNCSPTQTCHNAQRAGAQAIILVHLKHKVEDIQIHTTEKDNWHIFADFVFKPDYQLPTLSSVEQHIKDKGYLPEIPSEKEVLENGLDLGNINVKLVQKIEELTLYLIKQEK
jgi:hypothetical protein